MSERRLLDVWLKLEWAKLHADALKVEIQRWCDAQGERLTAWTLTQKLDSDRQCIVVSLGSVALPTDWMLMIGDAVYNFRACLNYLAWDLVRAGAEPKPRNRKSVEFPIHTERGGFDRAVRIGLPGIRKEHLAVVEQHQPYHAARHESLVQGPGAITGPASHPLAVLQTLSNNDKHHNPQYTFPQNFGQLTFSADYIDFIVERLEPANPFPGVFYSGAEIATAYGRVTGPNPQVKVNLQGSTAIAIEPGLWLWDALDKIGVAIAGLVSEVEPLL